jgi:hypothetical protein
VSKERSLLLREDSEGTKWNSSALSVVLELLHPLLNGQVWAVKVPAGDLNPLAHLLQSFLREVVECQAGREETQKGLTRSISPNSSDIWSIFAFSSPISSSCRPRGSEKREERGDLELDDGILLLDDFFMS